MTSASVCRLQYFWSMPNGIPHPSLPMVSVTSAVLPVLTPCYERLYTSCTLPYRGQCDTVYLTRPYRGQCDTVDITLPYRGQCDTVDLTLPYPGQCYTVYLTLPYRGQCDTAYLTVLTLLCRGQCDPYWTPAHGAELTCRDSISSGYCCGQRPVQYIRKLMKRHTKTNTRPIIGMDRVNCERYSRGNVSKTRSRTARRYCNR